MSDDVKKVKIHYRLAKLEGQSSVGLTLQDRLVRVMNSSIGLDVGERICAITDDGEHSGCLNFSNSQSSFFVADIMHLDGRQVLPRWVHPIAPRPVAEIVPREIAEGEASLGEPVYIMVSGNHVAAIERLGFRTVNLVTYLNALLRKGGELETGTNWKLVPKIEMSAGFAQSGGVKRIIVKPNAVLGGDAPSLAPPQGHKTRAASVIEDFIFQGRKLVEMLVAAGADEAKLSRLQAQMSTDLVLKAKLELSVASVRRKTRAEISSDDVQLALAELAAQGTVTVISTDGKTDGKLLQLAHTAEVLETGGLIHWDRATQALSSAMSAWAAKGAIELAGG